MNPNHGTTIHHFTAATCTHHAVPLHSYPLQEGVLELLSTNGFTPVELVMTSKPVRLQTPLSPN